LTAGVRTGSRIPNAIAVILCGSRLTNHIVVELTFFTKKLAIGVFARMMRA